MTITRRNASSVALAKRRIAHLRGLSEVSPVGTAVPMPVLTAGRANDLPVETEVDAADHEAAAAGTATD